jgi:DNA-binding NtrC family response regulator
MIITLPSLSAIENNGLWDSMLSQIAKSTMHCLITGALEETQDLLQALMIHPELSPIKTHFLRDISLIPLETQRLLAKTPENRRFVITSEYDIETALKRKTLEESLYEKLKNLVIQFAPKNNLRNHAFTQTVLVNTASLGENIALKDHLLEIENRYIEEALFKAKGVISLAAKMLGLRRTTLIEKIKKMNLKKFKTLNN